MVCKSAYLPSEKIVFTEDIIATQMADPLIHLAKNGSSEAWITTTKGMVALNSDQFVPGHGELQTKAAIQKRLADAEDKRAKIKDLVAQGKSGWSAFGRWLSMERYED